jgi:ornithine cyclodeaminase/alanine dehydrogenase-like protein (mu-crystallin family)
MPPLTILSNDDVNRILHSFTKEDIEHLQTQLADALHWYSTSADDNEYGSDYQPERISLKRKDGSTTLFLPASGCNGQAVKVINITPPDAAGLPNLDGLSLDSPHSTRSSISSPTTGSSSPRGSVSTFSSTATTASSNTTATSNTAASSRSSVPDPTSPMDDPDKTTSTIRGSLTLMDALGNTTGLVNAEDVTAFRTALASTMLLKKRQSVHDLTVFGAGRQAYWHIRLALLLRGPEIHHLNIITRNFESARRCIMRLYNPLPDDPDYVNTIGEKYNSNTKKNILTPMHTEYERLVKEYIRSSNVIFCCTPSTSPLFPAGYLTNPEGRKKGRYIACIGSFKPHMIELHPDVLRYAVAPHHEHRHLHKRQKEGGAVIVDTVSGCLKEAGEILQAKLLPDQVVELGELFMLKREAMRKMAEKGEHVPEGGCFFQDDSGLKEWLTRGNVIYKSVGLGLMDVIVGHGLVEMANERGVGTVIRDFN